MEALRFTRLKRLASLDSFSVALTAYLPVLPDNPEVDPKKLGKLQEKAEKALAKTVDVREVESFRVNLDYVLDRVTDASYTDGTWFLAVTPSEAEALFLPFQLKETIEVGKKLNPYPALYAFYRADRYFVAVLSENTARFYEYIQGRLFGLDLSAELKEALEQLHKARQALQSGTPSGDKRYDELFGQMARAAYQMALVKYKDLLSEYTEYYLTKADYPVMLMGEERLLQTIAEKLPTVSHLTRIAGIYEGAPAEQITAQVTQHLERRRAILLQTYQPFLAYSDPQSPQEIWRILQDTVPNPPVLLAAEGYSFPATEILPGKKGLPTTDGLDLIIEKVRERNGEVLFVSPDSLPSPLVLLIP